MRMSDSADSIMVFTCFMCQGLFDTNTPYKSSLVSVSARKEQIQTFPTRCVVFLRKNYDLFANRSCLLPQKLLVHPENEH